MQAPMLELQVLFLSFGVPQVDQTGTTGRFPTPSQLTGLIANVLGYAHGDASRTHALHERLSLASARVGEGEELEDYQQVDLGQTHLRNTVWTTHGRKHRVGGPGTEYGTHIRYLRFWANSSVLCALSVSLPNQEPTLTVIGEAIRWPAQPLVPGRNPCLAATQMVVGMVDDAESLRHALEQVPSTFSTRWQQLVAGLDDVDEIRAERPVEDRFVPPSGSGLVTHRVINRRGMVHHDSVEYWLGRRARSATQPRNWLFSARRARGGFRHAFTSPLRVPIDWTAKRASRDKRIVWAARYCARSRPDAPDIFDAH